MAMFASKILRSTTSSQMTTASTTMTRPRVNPHFRPAILYQAGPVPAVGGVVKPPKPGGYADSGADIAYALSTSSGPSAVITPTTHPSPLVHLDWVFPDTPSGIRHAVSLGANVLWANTTLHASHALVELRSELSDQGVRVVGQNPLDVERYEDKAWMNGWLANQEGLQGVFPRAMLWKKEEGVGAGGKVDMTALKKKLEENGIQVPCVVKPVRGRGSHGVSMVNNDEELERAMGDLLEEGDLVLVEEYCAGEEITITVLPPGTYSDSVHTSHWSLPVVTRFNHQNGIAPYNGVVAVTANSRALTLSEHAADPEYARAQKHCEIIAQLCRAKAPMRVDGRRRKATDGSGGGAFVLFDVNMKPNATGPGRPGREDQMSLTGMAAEAIGWDFDALTVNILNQAVTVEDLFR